MTAPAPLQGGCPWRAAAGLPVAAPALPDFIAGDAFGVVIDRKIRMGSGRPFSPWIAPPSPARAFAACMPAQAQSAWYIAGMKLNHAHLFTAEVAATSDVLTRHFAFAVEQAGEGFAMLRGSDGFSLVLMAFGPDGPRRYPSAKGFGMRIATHIGFVVETAEAVRAKHAELDDSGCRPDPIKTFEALGKSWTAFYCPLGDGLEIEVATHT